MRLSHLHVKNYRGLREVSIPLSSFVCITGENNAGKSSVLQCLSLFLSGSSLKTSDFFDPSLDITISILFSDISNEDLELLAEEHRKRIATLIINGQLTLVRKYGSDGKSVFGFYGLIPKDPRFLDDNVSALLAGKKGSQLKDVVISAFPELKEMVASSISQTACRELIDELGHSLPATEKIEQFKLLTTGFDKSVIPMLPERIYIPAVKDLSDDTKTAETSSFGKILAIIMKAIQPALSEEKDLFERLSKKLTRIVSADGVIEDHRLEEIKKVEATIEKYVQESFANVSLEIDIPPPELKSVLSTARIMADDGMRGPLELKGDGLRRAVVFSILRSYVEFSRSQAQEDMSGKGYLLLFEEPELFLHPDAQKILFDALAIFSQKNHVVVTTHSPLFLGPESVATFIRLSKEVLPSTTKPYTKSKHVDLSGMDARDEFQIICFENNSAAFFAKKVVLVEGDSDFIAYPHIAKTLKIEWNCHSKSVAFVRVGGKGSIARYRSFFKRFGLPILVISDLDCLINDFNKLNPSETAIKLREDLIKAVDSILESEEVKMVRTEDIHKAQESAYIRKLWEKVLEARRAYDADRNKFDELNNAVQEFFAWEKKYARLDCIRKGEQAKIKEIKLNLIWELRESGVFLLENGTLENYYPLDIVGGDKPARAQRFIQVVQTPEMIKTLCPMQTCPKTGNCLSEFEFIFSSIFGN